MADRTDDYINHIKMHFVGHQVDQPLMTFEDNTSSTPLGRVGNQIKAKGWVKIEDLLHHQGSIQQIDLPVAPHVLWVADLVMVFKYKGWTHGERWVWPGGLFVDNVWDSLHPEGTVSIHLKYVPGQNGQMAVSATVNPGHPDRPNRFIADLARRTAGHADSLTEGFTGQAVAVG